ncbi:MAG: PTS sugar transporter subunit IIB [bacterium]
MGQIIATWLPFLRTRQVLIANDQAPENALQMSMFQMTVPSGTAVTALSVAEAGAWLGGRRYGRDSTLVLIETVEDAVRLFESGDRFPALNVGNVHHGAGSRRFTNAVYLSDAQLDGLRGLMRRGVQVEIRSLPDEAPIDLKRALGEP